MEPEISEELKALLEGEITEEGVKNAIFCLHNNKALGPDGLSIEYYKILSPECLIKVTQQCIC